jgi:outer membrane autotransporter protein
MPLYRMEVPIYAEVPALARELGLAQLGTFHDRQGNQSLLDESGPLPAAWARTWGKHAELDNNGAADPAFSGTMAGVQAGHDLYADANAAGHRNHFGLLVGYGRAQGDVTGFAIGVPNSAVGHLSIDSYSLGGYWTHIGPGGWYTDAVLVGTALTIDPASNRGVSATVHGQSAIASLEAGLPIPLSASLSLEPQARLIWQHTSINDFNDGISSVSFRTANGWIGRLGLRVEGRFDAAGMTWQPFARANLWHYGGGTDTVTFAGPTVVPTEAGATAAEFALGVVSRIGARGSIYASAGYTTNVGGEHRQVVEGNLGLRWRW